MIVFVRAHLHRYRLRKKSAILPLVENLKKIIYSEEVFYDLNYSFKKHYVLDPLSSSISL